MIEIRGVTKKYQMGENLVHALRGVDLRIDEGDFVAIMGPSGSGKSTLAHILGLLDVPSSGSYQLRGEEVAHLSQDELAVLRREEIGFIFQQFNLLPRMTALDNIALPLFYSKKETGTVRAAELLKMVGLDGRGDHRPNELSGGQQQRVAIARALVNRPRLIFADEPTGNLDSVSEKEIMEQLKTLNREGITVVMVTHEEEIGKQASRLVRMRDGLIVSDIRQAELVSISSKKESHAKSLATELWRDVLEHFVVGYQTLLANKVRTALSMLGILIGVAAVVAMLALGRGAQIAIESQLSSLGSNLLVIRPGSAKIGGVSKEGGGRLRLLVDDVHFLKQRLAGVSGVAPTVDGRVQVAYLNKNWNTQVLGTLPEYAKIRSSVPTMGRFFSEDENSNRALVAVIGTTVARELFPEINPVGETIKVNRISFQVIGVLPTKGGGGWRDQDDVVIIPLETAMRRVLGVDRLDTIEIEMMNSKVMETAEDTISEMMLERKKVPPSQREEALRVMNMADIQDAISQSSKTMSALLASIAAISLLVGGIGIMNIMLVSVTERTREIGLRKAIGAKGRDILLQFLAESVVVSAVGGLAGIFLGWMITVTLSLAVGWKTSVSLSSVALAFIFSAFVGMVFGIYPAKQASKLNPIDALRHD
jgi:macrolide transport system ATP-binding/permease protein